MAFLVSRVGLVQRDFLSLRSYKKKKERSYLGRSSEETKQSREKEEGGSMCPVSHQYGERKRLSC